MKCFSLIIGSRNTPGAAAKFRKRDDKTIQDITKRHFPMGSTIVKNSGSWLNPATGLFIDEESRQVLVCANASSELKGWYNQICYAMQQDALMLIELGPVSFISSDPIKLQAIRTKVKATVITGTARQAPKSTM
jgi:hypothetical protein